MSFRLYLWRDILSPYKTWRTGRRLADHSGQSVTRSARFGAISYTRNQAVRAGALRRPCRVELYRYTSISSARSYSTGVQSLDEDVKSSVSARAGGRSCLLTGATSGIGYAIMKQLFLEGATHIRIVTRDKSRGQNAVDRAQKDTGITSVAVEIIEDDLDTTQTSVKKFFATEEDWPVIDTLIYSAGISQTSLAISTRPDVSSRIMKVNFEIYSALLAAFLKTYHLRLSKSKDTQQFNQASFSAVGVSSLLASKGGYGSSTYAASKAAMIAYNRAISLEAGQIARKSGSHAPAFRVNTVLPGYIDTPMISNFSEQTTKDLTDNIPLGRFGRPEEVADAVMFLLANEYANNCVLNLDGGLSAV